MLIPVTNQFAIGAAGGGFSPLDIAGLVAWYDASDAATITESSGSVSQWDDKSGNDYHLTQGTGSLQPTTGTRTINSLNALDFAADALANASAMPSGVPVTVYVVCNLDVVNWDHNILGSAASGYSASEALNTRGDNKHFYTYNGTGVESAAAASTSTTYVVALMLDTGAATIRVNGTNGTPADRGSNDFWPTTNLVVGANATTGTYPCDGMIGEVIAYSGILSFDDLTSLDTYLSDKWGA